MLGSQQNGCDAAASADQHCEIRFVVRHRPRFNRRRIDGNAVGVPNRRDLPLLRFRRNVPGDESMRNSGESAIRNQDYFYPAPAPMIAEEDPLPESTPFQ